MPRLKAFNKNENEKRKKIMLAIPIVLVVIAVVIVASSYAIFQTEAEGILINATVGDFGGDIKLAIMVDGKETDALPTRGIYESITVDCGGNATGSWNTDKWKAEIGEIKTKKVSCTVNFTKLLYSIGQEVQVANGDTIESFYVIGGNKNKIALLSKFPINKFLSIFSKARASSNVSNLPVPSSFVP